MAHITGFARVKHARHRALGAALAVTLALVTAATALAQSYVLDEDAWITDGAVNAMVAAGNTIYLAGAFGLVGPHTGSFSGVDLETGIPIPGWPRVDGRVYCSVGDGAGGAFIGGDFTTVGGAPRAGLAHLLADRSVAAWSPGADRAVYALERIGGTVYAGGEFTTLGGQQRRSIGAVDAETGAVSAWNPGADGEVLVFAAGNGRLFAGGYFRNIGGRVRNGVAAFDAVTGAITAWDPHPVYPSLTQVTALTVDGTTLYIGGGFRTIGGQSRNYLAAIDLQTEEVTGWDPGADNIPMAILPNGSTVYVGGYFERFGDVQRRGVAELDRTTGAPTAFDAGVVGSVWRLQRLGDALYMLGGFETVAGQERLFAAAVDVASGALRAWNPSPNLPGQTMVMCGQTLCVGGEYIMLGGVRRSGLAAIDLPTGRATDWHPEVGGAVLAMALNGSALHVGGRLSSIGGQSRSRLGAVDVATGLPTSWAPEADGDVECMSLLDGTIYLGGGFNTVGTQARRRLAAVNANTGEVLAWNPGIDDPFDAQRVFAIAAHGATVYAGGWFSSVGGQPRQAVAAIDASSGAVLPWNPGYWSAVLSMSVAGSTLYVGGDFARIGGQNRSALAALDSATGNATDWNPGVEDGYVRVVHASGGKVHAGGVFTRVGGVDRRDFVEFDAVSGQATSWNPAPDEPVVAIVRAGSALCLGGEFNHVAGVMRRGFAIFRAADTAPPAVQLLAPNGHETATIGQPFDVTWLASDDVGVEAVDVQLSRAGRAGPWETIAAGLADSGHFTWSVTGPMALDEAWVRVIVRDAAGNTAADTSDGAFTILDPAVPTLVELFRAVPVDGGVRVEWRMSDPGAWRDLTLDRATSEAGAWARVGATALAEGRLSVVIDPDAAPGQTWWYRLSGVDRDGRALTLGTLSVRAGERITAWALSPLAPNPTAGRTSVSYAVPAAGRVRLTLADVQGREVAVLLDATREPGRYVASLDAADLRPGMYFVRMQAAGVSLVRRLVLTR